MIPRGGKANVRPIPQLSLSSLCPVNFRLPGERLFVVLKAYFDGSNKADSITYDCLTLAAILGDENQWKGLEQEWKAVLDEHEAPWLHTTDAVAMNTPYSRDEGWTDTSRDAFISDCVRAVSHHIQHGYHEGLKVYTVTIPLKDYVRAREDNPDVPKSASDICAVQAINQIFRWGGSEVMYVCTFDQGEDFRGHICDREKSQKAKKRFPTYSRLTTLSADMRLVPALQCADLFAWCRSHEGLEQRFCWQKEMEMLHWHDETTDYKRLMQPIKEMVDITRSFNLPKRKLHR